ncbi:MAG: hypothetical protein HZB61_00885 [Nitrospirae bacterium]|nr:hypothetical protein [Nitrospirota bacterium]
MKYKRLSFSFHLLLLTSCFLLLTSLIACGRRGDPVPIEPQIEKAVEEKSDERQGEKTIQKTVQEPVTTKALSAPTGLMGVYTQQGIVLTWDDMERQDVKLYRIYRSTGGDFAVAGETVTPAFTDKNAGPDKRYIYKVTAVGAAEGPPSKEIKISTEIK